MKRDLLKYSRSNVSLPKELAQNLFVYVPIILCFGSITPPELENWFPATLVLEVCFFATIFLVSAFSPPPDRFGLWLLILSWFALRYGLALTSEIPPPWEEFLRAHKWMVYLLALFSARRSKVLQAPKLNQLVNVLLVASFIKYSYVWLLLGFSARPAIFTENNYEVFLLLGLVVVSSELGYKKSPAFLAVLTIVVALSGSRSGAGGLVVLFVYLLTKSRSKSQLTQYLSLMSVFLVAALSVSIFQARTGNVQALDRFNFLSRFQFEVAEWGLLEWLFGAPPLTPLSLQTCYSLSYYAALLSETNDGSCYSVILHSHVLRLIFDFGLLGLFACLFLVFSVLRASEFTIKGTATLISLVVVNGLSVSGINNVYLALPILAAVITKPPEKETHL